jgi:hypothetical protein
MTSNFRRNSTPSPPSATSQHRSGNGAALQLPIIDSSDDDLPFLSYKLSALTNALLHSENSQQEPIPNEFSANRISDNVERQPKSDSSRLYWQGQSSNSSGCGLPASDNTRPMRIVRIKSKAPGARGTNTPRESQRSPQLSEISAERSQFDGSISGKLVTPSPRFYSSKIEAANSESSATAVERLTQSEYALRRGASSVLRYTKSAGTSILGPPKRFNRKACDEASSSDGILYTSGIGGVEELEQQSECHDEAPPIHGTDQSQLHVMALKCHDNLESGVRNLENPKTVSYTRNNAGNFVNMTSPSKSSSGHQRNPPDLPLEYWKENDQPPMVFPNRKSINNHLDNYVDPRPEYKEKQNATPSLTSPQRKPLGILGINNPHRPPLPPQLSVLQMATKAAGAATASSKRKKRVYITINNNAYQRLECIGRGGSCRVYRVMSENFKIWALKKVSLADVDETAVRGFKGEIELLRRLLKVDRVVQLRDWEVNEAKQTLSVVNTYGCQAT